METVSIIRPELLSFSVAQKHVLFPYLCVLAGALLTVLMSAIKYFQSKWFVYILSLGTLSVGIYLNINLFSLESVLLFNRMMISDTFSAFFYLIF